MLWSVFFFSWICGRLLAVHTAHRFYVNKYLHTWTDMPSESAGNVHWEKNACLHFLWATQPKYVNPCLSFFLSFCLLDLISCINWKIQYCYMKIVFIDYLCGSSVWRLVSGSYCEDIRLFCFISLSLKWMNLLKSPSATSLLPAPFHWHN